MEINIDTKKETKTMHTNQKSQNYLQNYHSSPSHPLGCLHFQQFHG